MVTGANAQHDGQNFSTFIARIQKGNSKSDVIDLKMARIVSVSFPQPAPGCAFNFLECDAAGGNEGVIYSELDKDAKLRFPASGTWSSGRRATTIGELAGFRFIKIQAVNSGGAAQALTSEWRGKVNVRE